MILKQREDSREAIDQLEALLNHPRADSHVRHQIEQQIANIRYGDMGEAQAAYHIDVDYGKSPNWIVIHDLRLEHDGLVAQIDHLLINRLLDIWVLESKRFKGGIKINERGECLTFSARRPIAVDSPIEQNRRHVKILQALLDSGTLSLPMRLGRQLRPKLRSLVLIAGGTITRPNTPIPGIETIIKTDQVLNTIKKHGENGNPLDLMKIVSADTIAALGQQLCDCHRPIQFDWERRLRLTAAPTAKPIPAIEPPVSQPKTTSAACETCNAPLSPGIVRFCKTNGERFNRRLLCMTCQKAL